MAIWWQKWAAWFTQELQQPEKSERTPEGKQYEYTMRHPNVKLLAHEKSGKSRFACVHHGDFVDDYETMKNTHWGCPECNTLKNNQLTPYIPTSPKSTRELALAWYWQRREQNPSKKDDMAKLCDEIESQQAVKILSYRILPSEQIRGKMAYEFTIECDLDGILQSKHLAFSSANIPPHICPTCEKRWNRSSPNKVRFPIQS